MNDVPEIPFVMVTVYRADGSVHHANVMPWMFAMLSDVPMEQIQPPGKGIVIMFDEFAKLPARVVNEMVDACDKYASGMQRAADACGLIADECEKLQYERNECRTYMRAGYLHPQQYTRCCGETQRVRRRAFRHYRNFTPYMRPRLYGRC
jgi:hypothetical protein